MYFVPNSSAPFWFFFAEMSWQQTSTQACKHASTQDALTILCAFIVHHDTMEANFFLRALIVLGLLKKRTSPSTNPRYTRNRIYVPTEEKKPWPFLKSVNTSTKKAQIRTGQSSRVRNSLWPPRLLGKSSVFFFQLPVYSLHLPLFMYWICM